MAMQQRRKVLKARGKRTDGAMAHPGTPLAYAKQAKETNSFLLEKGQTVQPRRLVFFFGVQEMDGALREENPCRQIVNR